MDTRKNIILTGFMGTGKTTVGEFIAQQLGMEFIDLDEWIEKQRGKSIREIFRSEGEETFRFYEYEACKQLSEKQHAVIATGGGTYLNPKNKELLELNGISFCLTCETEELYQRLRKDTQRPLLEDEDPQRRINELLRKRDGIYSAIPWQINTTNERPDEIGRRIIQIYKTRELDVKHPQGSYPIYLGYQILPLAGVFIRSQGIDTRSRIAIISNHQVASLYAKSLINGLENEGYATILIEIEDGEKAKNLDTVKEIYHALVRDRINRYDVILALGGGVTGDIAGFVAATYYRGVPFIQVPTTLLAMVDSSIGGKTGVDMEEGKNLIGAFKQPELVLIDVSVLSTLPIEEMRCGMAEVIKHAILADGKLLEDIENNSGDYGVWLDENIATSWLERAIMVKKAVVEEDPFEKGKRACLNLGHTIGHAIETLSQYRIKHGEAVSIGLAAESRIAQRKGLAAEGLVERIEKVLLGWHLPIKVPDMETNVILDAIKVDKKSRANQVRWVLPCDIEKVEINHTVDRNMVADVLEEMQIKST